ncbi:capsular polysaccharide transport system permease protein [Loktanella sp. DSM 29012]|uniref:Sugar transporter n=1 Tax=Loktanella gaetbuli TaxID=2881335 RepID=A0ABS8BYS0_9RHOB|nr:MULTISPECIES: sugar transporter [Loktanella]MCB5200686.1 sugar transporter [Loktanella gaetbuli]SEQ77127.1 capsular polysaccharide transport system permease protein [Loktanella sp. DSM 29012]
MTETPQTPEPTTTAAPAAPKKPAKPIKPVAGPARVRKRHWGLVVSFAVITLLPILLSAFYLWGRAADQYASTLGFTVRSEEVATPADMLSGLGGGLAGGGSASRETDILYEFIRSQEMVRQVDAALDLKTIYARHHDSDPLLGFDPDGATIEDLTSYWQRMVRISYDSGTGLMELLVLAFDPADATRIAEEIFEQGSTLINQLSQIARDDATRYAQEDLLIAVDRLKYVREALTTFRLQNQIVDLTADIQGQMGLLNTLQAQQAAALIEFDLISETASASDPRVAQARRRLEVIEARIAEERRKFGSGGGSADPEGVEYAETVAEFERLTVDREYAENAYALALSAFDVARGEANRQSFYLAPYITPTLAEKSQYPQRWLILSLVALFSFLIWAITSLIYYALRDRK